MCSLNIGLVRAHGIDPIAHGVYICVCIYMHTYLCVYMRVYIYIYECMYFSVRDQ